MWASRPSKLVIVSSIADIAIIPVMAAEGVLMAPLPVWLIGFVFLSAIALAFALDTMKLVLFRYLQMA